MGANMMLTIGAIVLFGMFLGSTNKLMIGNNQIAAQNEYYITGLSLAQSIIDEAKTKAFDQKTVNADTVVVPYASLTLFNKLQSETGETVPKPDTNASNIGFMSAVKFNDIDDYNKYTRKVSTPRAEGYSLEVNVKYVRETDPDLPENSQTYCKRMIVNVTSPYFRKNGYNGGPDTLTLSYTFTY